jgi:predicted TIM-barrel fold metal-dependent hydrolase
VNYTASEQWLLDRFADMEIIDAHTHLPVERVRLAEHTDALTFYRQYTRLVMFSGGLDETTFLRIHDPDRPLHERFDLLEPHLEQIQFSSAGRAATIALERFYGETKLTRDNIERITQKMGELHRPGVLYRTVLEDACSIRQLVQNAPPHEVDFDDRLLRPVPMIGIGGEWNEFNDLAESLRSGEIRCNSPDEYIEDRKERLIGLARRGAAAFKTTSHPYCEPDRRNAREIFDDLRSGRAHRTSRLTPNPLHCYLSDALFAAVEQLGLPVAVHTGVWGDFRESDPTHVIPYIQSHPGLRFDLFHMGIPSVREFGRIGANFGNAWLNMCWAPTLSTTMVANALDEWMDMVAMNKIIAFGSDTRWPVEKVYGHLKLAQEAVATVLGRRMDRGLMLAEEALSVARKWFFENPAALYRLDHRLGRSVRPEAKPNAATVRHAD